MTINLSPKINSKNRTQNDQTSAKADCFSVQSFKMGSNAQIFSLDVVDSSVFCTMNLILD